MKNILDILVDNKILSSKGEGRKLIEGRSIKVNGKVITSTGLVLQDDNLTIKIGKSKEYKIQ